MPGIITTGNHPKALWPGVKSWWGRTYNEHEKEWPKLFDQTTSTQAWEEYVELTGFGLTPVKRENGPFVTDSETQGTVARITNVAYMLGFIVTHEELMDNLYEIVSKRRAKALAFSMSQTEEIVHANMYNNGFTAGAYAIGDGAAWFSASHPCLTGNQSNTSTGADLSEGALEDLLTQIMLATNSRGLKINLMPKSVAVHPSKWWDSQRIIKSALQSDSNLNNINVIAATRAIPEGVILNHYFATPGAFFIRTNAPESTIHQDREGAKVDMDNDFQTMNAFTRGYQRYGLGVGDWRGCFANPGP